MTRHLEKGGVLREIHVDGVLLDCRVRGGLIRELRPELVPGEGEWVIEGGGADLLPGLHDHHVHVRAAAAARLSLDLNGEGLPDSALPGSGAVRVVGLGDDDATRWHLDAVWPDRPARAQHRSGALWVLNTVAVEALDGQLSREEARTGRVWRDSPAWPELGVGSPEPGQVLAEAAALGASWRERGLTSVSDASPHLTAVEASELAAHFPLSLASMGPGHHDMPRKVIAHDHSSDAWDQLCKQVRQARDDGRPVACHAVSATGLALAVAAIADVGAMPGDRIEHAAVCDDAIADQVAALGLVVVTQPSIALRRTPHVLAHADPAEIRWMWRLRGLIERGVTVVLSSDAPHGHADPWATIRAAAGGEPGMLDRWAEREAISARAALQSYFGTPQHPLQQRHVAVGQAADLCLLRGRLDDVLAAVVRGELDDPVRHTLVGGQPWPAPDGH